MITATFDKAEKPFRPFSIHIETEEDRQIFRRLFDAYYLPGSWVKVSNLTMMDKLQTLYEDFFK